MSVFVIFLIISEFINGCAATPSFGASKLASTRESIVGDASQDQYDILTELYDLTSGEMWVNNTNWLVNKDNITLCDWHGISCSGKWVQSINLKKNGLGGPLPDRWERLPYLENIDFTSNK